MEPRYSRAAKNALIPADIPIVSQYMCILVTNRTPIASKKNTITTSQKCQGSPTLSSLMASRDAPHLKHVFLSGLFSVLHFSHFLTIILLILSAHAHGRIWILKLMSAVGSRGIPAKEIPPQCFVCMKAGIQRARLTCGLEKISVKAFS